MDISELLAFVVKNKASDLHLSSGLPPDDPGAWRHTAHQSARDGA